MLVMKIAITVTLLCAVVPVLAVIVEDRKYIVKRWHDISLSERVVAGCFAAGAAAVVVAVAAFVWGI
jgi:uncharacterized membrane protein YhaH (DUF805 family)